MPTVHSHQTYKKIKGTTMVFCKGTMVIQFLNTMIYECGTHLVPPYYSLMNYCHFLKENTVILWI